MKRYDNIDVKLWSLKIEMYGCKSTTIKNKRHDCPELIDLGVNYKYEYTSDRNFDINNHDNC